MLQLIADPNVWASLLTLTVMEIVLGIDNLVFISVLTGRLPPALSRRARAIGRRNGLRFVYTGNVHDEAGGATCCPGCGATLIGRDWYDITAWNLDDGACPACGTRIAGVFEASPGDWGRRRRRVGIAASA